MFDHIFKLRILRLKDCIDGDMHTVAWGQGPWKLLTPKQQLGELGYKTKSWIDKMQEDRERELTAVEVMTV